jgi:riboflavin synthase
LFTGIVQDEGTVVSTETGDQTVVLQIRSGLAGSMEIGGSIAVNGVCLTAVAVDESLVTVEVGAESLARTTLGGLANGAGVNLELPMSASSLFDGHIVQGHVDGTGIVSSVNSEGDSVRITVEAEPELMRYIVEKGSVTVDGVSLTVADATDSDFDVAIIPHTLKVTTFGGLEPGHQVNLETDVLAKYVEKLIR